MGISVPTIITPEKTQRHIDRINKMTEKLIDDVHIKKNNAPTFPFRET